eukprot:CAMPEP_0194400550 /NCGR_PEP_ID=MMETSP0174-20130528/127296_1 /TAXON_ID=216777 /ORGANISM="Proboscia alata, Strain PI-D3" /LENGTH=408 /DNA_ID=CAMNT_0039197119 /DNA_START=68 /DNA_END=1294 /DNA_ORIENTATION=-
MTDKEYENDQGESDPRVDMIKMDSVRDKQEMFYGESDLRVDLIKMDSARDSQVSAEPRVDLIKTDSARDSQEMFHGESDPQVDMIKMDIARVSQEIFQYHQREETRYEEAKSLFQKRRDLNNKAREMSSQRTKLMEEMDRVKLDRYKCYERHEETEIKAGQLKEMVDFVVEDTRRLKLKRATTRAEIESLLYYDSEIHIMIYNMRRHASNIRAENDKDWELVDIVERECVDITHTLDHAEEIEKEVATVEQEVDELEKEIGLLKNESIEKATRNVILKAHIDDMSEFFRSSTIGGIVKKVLKHRPTKGDEETAEKPPLSYATRGTVESYIDDYSECYATPKHIFSDDISEITPYTTQTSVTAVDNSTRNLRLPLARFSKHIRRKSSKLEILAVDRVPEVNSDEEETVT